MGSKVLLEQCWEAPKSREKVARGFTIRRRKPGMSGSGLSSSPLPFPAGGGFHRDLQREIATSSRFYFPSFSQTISSLFSVGQGAGDGRFRSRYVIGWGGGIGVMERLMLLLLRSSSVEWRWAGEDKWLLVLGVDFSGGTRKIGKRQGLLVPVRVPGNGDECSWKWRRMSLVRRGRGRGRREVGVGSYGRFSKRLSKTGVAAYRRGRLFFFKVCRPCLQSKNLIF
ncbi:hypothetical protein NC652_010297 [Populus alba x Populus x berolinensis]|nr:hypothetical protein NC652_010297 [Populus alba x Populus x berolinensis]